MRKIYIFVLLAAYSVVASGQMFQSAYFLDGMPTRHAMNPALGSETNYFSIPGLGHAGVDIRGNLDLVDLLKIRNVGGVDRTVTYMHPLVKMDELTFKENNKLMQDARIQLVGFGFKKWGGYNTFEINAREYATLDVSRRLLTMAKHIENADYSLGRAGVRAQAWGEVALGHSHLVSKRLRVGGKVKVLAGAARLDARADRMQLNLTSPDRWIATANAQVDVSMKDFSWGAPATKEYAYRTDPVAGTPATYETIDFDNINWGTPTVNGFGAAVDLGVECTLQDRGKGVKFSASILDLGAIRWSETHRAANDGTPLVFEGFQNVSISGSEGAKIKDLANELLDRATDFYAPHDMGTKQLTTPLGATLNVAVEYVPQRAKWLKLGAITTQRIEGEYSSNETRATVGGQYKFIEVQVSGACGTYGPSWGWVLNLKPRGFNVFLGMDHVVGGLTKKGIPLHSHAGVYLGMNVTFGKK